MGKSTLLRLFLGSVLLGMAFLGGYLLSEYNNPITKDILHLTPAVNSFSGYVFRIDGNVLTVGQERSSRVGSVDLAVLNKDKSIGATIKTVTYEVVITKETAFSRPYAGSPLLFSNGQATPPRKLSLKDVKVGQYIFAQTNTDLRTLKGNRYEAQSITLPQETTSLTGQVQKVAKNSLVVKQLVPFAAPPIGIPRNTDLEMKSFKVNITPSTEISSWDLVKQEKRKRPCQRSAGPGPFVPWQDADGRGPQEPAIPRSSYY